MKSKEPNVQTQVIDFHCMEMKIRNVADSLFVEVRGPAIQHLLERLHKEIRQVKQQGLKNQESGGTSSSLTAQGVSSDKMTIPEWIYNDIRQVKPLGLNNQEKGGTSSSLTAQGVKADKVIMPKVNRKVIYCKSNRSWRIEYTNESGHIVRSKKGLSMMQLTRSYKRLSFPKKLQAIHKGFATAVATWNMQDMSSAPRINVEDHL